MVVVVDEVVKKGRVMVIGRRTGKEVVIMRALYLMDTGVHEAFPSLLTPFQTAGRGRQILEVKVFGRRCVAIS